VGRRGKQVLPFFDFHIDVEREGKLLCLRLTGEEGIKAFIRAEIGVEKNEVKEIKELEEVRK